MPVVRSAPNESSKSVKFARQIPRRYRKVVPIHRFPRAVIVERTAAAAPGVGKTRTSEAQPFVPDGFIFPRPEDQFFDFLIRVPLLAVNSTVEQTVFTSSEQIKGGWIRKIGYGFNQPQGFFQVRTTLLINSAPPANYMYRTIDSTSPDTFQGSFPTTQLGPIEEPTDVYIALPSSALVSIRFLNTSTVASFSVAVRLWGWFFSG